MPRIKKKGPTRRLNLEMDARVRERLESLCVETGADSLTEVIRRSLAVYDYLWAEKSNGAKLIVKSDNDEKEVVLL